MEFPGLLLPEPFRQVFPSDHRDDSFSVSDEAKPAGGKDSRAAVKDLIVRRFKAAAEEVGSNRFIFGPGCALPTGGSYLNHIIYETVEEYGRTKH